MPKIPKREAKCLLAVAPTSVNVGRSGAGIDLSASPHLLQSCVVSSFSPTRQLTPVQVEVLERTRARVTRKDPLSYITSDSNPPGQCFMITTFHHRVEEAPSKSHRIRQAGRNLAQICNNNSLRARARVKIPERVSKYGPAADEGVDV